MDLGLLNNNPGRIWMMLSLRNCFFQLLWKYIFIFYYCNYVTCLLLSRSYFPFYHLLYYSSPTRGEKHVKHQCQGTCPTPVWTSLRAASLLEDTQLFHLAKCRASFWPDPHLLFHNTVPSCTGTSQCAKHSCRVGFLQFSYLEETLHNI